MGPNAGQLAEGDHGHALVITLIANVVNATRSGLPLDNSFIDLRTYNVEAGELYVVAVDHAPERTRITLDGVEQVPVWDTGPFVFSNQGAQLYMIEPVTAGVLRLQGARNTSGNSTNSLTYSIRADGYRL